MQGIKEMLINKNKNLEKLSSNVKEMSIGKGKEVSTVSIENSSVKKREIARECCPKQKTWSRVRIEGDIRRLRCQC